MESRNDSMTGKPDALDSVSETSGEGPKTATRQALQQLMATLGSSKTPDQQCQILDNLKINPSLMAAFFQNLRVFAMRQQLDQCACAHALVHQQQRHQLEQREQLHQRLLEQLKKARDQFEQETKETEELLEQRHEQRRQELQEKLQQWESKLKQWESKLYQWESKNCNNSNTQEEQHYEQQQVQVQQESQEGMVIIDGAKSRQPNAVGGPRCTISRKRSLEASRTPIQPTLTMSENQLQGPSTQGKVAKGSER